MMYRMYLFLNPVFLNNVYSVDVALNCMRRASGLNVRYLDWSADKVRMPER